MALRDDDLTLACERLALTLFQQRFRIERVDLADSPIAEN
jgi:hypothetical protein